MSLVIETGVGVRSANAYVTVAFVTSYLADRNRSTEGAWNTINTTQKEAAIIAATDYIEKRFSGRFLGQTAYSFQSVASVGSVAFSGLPANGEALLLGDQTYTFKNSLSGSPYEVLIGVSAAATAANLVAAINADPVGGGIYYGTGTSSSRHASAALVGSTVNLTALADGSSGDVTVLSGAVTNAVLTAFAGGKDGGSQPLSFPRSYLYDRTGCPIIGIPLKLKQASAEYAVRAASSPLLVDPTTDPFAGRVKARKSVVGPIEESIEYESGAGTVTIKPYPAADKLLSEYLLSGGQVIR